MCEVDRVESEEQKRSLDREKEERRERDRDEDGVESDVGSVSMHNANKLDSI
ncbi:hypothetical protein TIFTF001_021087 [Ficus carica]|uniref:Uncharacterized protein n=1 Tax=Ficus carica TaxID=3494 RepID=A0AA88AGV4_FICCA|nr:hypothetical protein TIFTF001_021087 [Ficus carica]